MAGFLLFAPALALAQVTVNPAALQQLEGISMPPPAIAAPSVAMKLVHHRPHVRRVAPVTARGPSPARLPVTARGPSPAGLLLTARGPSPARLPVTARGPLPAGLPVVAPKVMKPATPPPTSHIAPISLIFAPGSADLPVNAASALKPLCGTKTRIAIDARAPSDPADPSAAMRLSLTRALAVQGALTACGIQAQNILPRANGDVPGANEDEALISGASP